MKKILILIIAVSVVFTMQAQKEEKARGILEQVTKKTKSYASIKIKFKYIIDNRAENMKDTTKGTIYLKGNKFKLFFQGNEIFSDGATMWTHQVDAGEITINDVDTEDDDALNPANILTMYEKGFKYRYMGEIKIGGKSYYQIDLYPENPDEKSYSIIKLKIDKVNSHLSSVKMVGKDGVDYIIDLIQFKPNVKVVDSMFSFDKTKYPKNIEINDMRD
ncbi:MAG: outer membrane lipoprotein carrier protein LolA [Bacteroidota bacterium]